MLALSWLYAYYCFDYKWGLQGVRLTERLAYFERRWAFFAGAEGLGGRGSLASLRPRPRAVGTTT